MNTLCRLISIFVLMVFFGYALSSSAHAGENERQKIIIEMFEVMEYGKIIDQISSVVSQQITAEIKKKAPNIPSDALTDIGSIAQEEFSELKPDLMKFVGVFMAKNFTEEELVQFLEFYKSPVGKKSTLIMPQMMQEMMAWMPSVTGKFGQKTMTRVKAMLQSKGHQL
jgi:hypothetical protein